MKTSFYLALLSFIITTISCQKENIEPKNELKELSEFQVKLKTNLDKTAKIITQIVNDEDVKKELNQISTIKKDLSKIRFKELFNKESKTSNNFKSLRNEFLQKISNQKDRDDLVQFLSENNCYLYIPYPNEWYNSNSNYAVAGHPITNDIEGIGYVQTESKSIEEVTINEEYADSSPVILIMPEDNNEAEPLNPEIEEEDMVDPEFGTSGSGLNSIQTVYIGM